MSRFSKLEVIDPDAIARYMPPGKAAREALRRRRLALLERRSFLVETTLSGTGIFRLMKAVRKEGYMIVLHYVSLGSPEQALDRIRNRVARGATMFRNMTCGVDSRGLMPIFRLRFSWRTKSFSMTIHCPSGGLV